VSPGVYGATEELGFSLTLMPDAARLDRLNGRLIRQCQVSEEFGAATLRENSGDALPVNGAYEGRCSSSTNGNFELLQRTPTRDAVSIFFVKIFSPVRTAGSHGMRIFDF